MKHNNNNNNNNNNVFPSHEFVTTPTNDQNYNGSVFEVDWKKVVEDPELARYLEEVGNENEFLSPLSVSSAHSEKTFNNNEHLPSNNSNPNPNDFSSNLNNNANSFFQPQPTVNTGIPKPPGSPPNNILVGAGDQWPFKYDQEKKAYFLNKEDPKIKETYNLSDAKNFRNYINNRASRIADLIKLDDNTNTFSIDIEKYYQLISVEQKIILPAETEFNVTNSIIITHGQPLKNVINQMEQRNYPDIIIGKRILSLKFTLHDGTYFHRVEKDPANVFSLFEGVSKIPTATEGLEIKEHPDHLHLYWTLENFKKFFNNCIHKQDLQKELLKDSKFELKFVFSEKKNENVEAVGPGAILDQIPPLLKPLVKRSYEEQKQVSVDAQTLFKQYGIPRKKPREEEPENLNDNNSTIHRPQLSLNLNNPESVKKFMSNSEGLHLTNNQKKKSAPPPQPSPNSYKK